jgi:IS5 family transposase
MGCGSGMTCWRRLKEWNEAGVWEELHRRLLDRLGQADQIDWERAALDSASVPELLGGQRTRANPTDKGKAGSKRHCVVERKGIRLSVIHSAANVHDSKVLEEAVDAIEPIRKPRRGRPKEHPKKLHSQGFSVGYGRAKTAQWWKRGSINQHSNARKKRASGTMVMFLVFARYTLASSVR